MEIDNLSIGLKVNGADQAVQNILSLAEAVERIATGVGIIDSDKLSSFAKGIGEIKNNIPSAGQVERMIDFSAALDAFVTALGGVDISGFASSFSAISAGVQGVGGKNSVKTLTNTAEALNTVSQQAQKTASDIGSVGEKLQSGTQTKSGEQLAIQFKNANEELTKTAISADSLGAKLRKIGVIKPTKQFASLENQIDKLKIKYDTLRDKIAMGLESGKITTSSDKYKEMVRDLEAIRTEYDQLILKQKELALEGEGFQLNPTLNAGLNSFKKSFWGVIKVARNDFVGAIKFANKHLASFVKNLFNANSAQKAMKKTMDTLKSFPEKFAKGLTRIGKMLKLMVTRMALRQVIKEVGEGFKSLALHSEEFDNRMSDVINASKQLGYSFASMVGPLLNAILPAIVTVIEYLTKLINVINQVFSALRGLSTWNKAIAFTDKWSDSIKEAGKSGSKAAKELKKTVLGFDELNQLQDNKNSGGGGGSDIKDMFETVDIDPKWKEFAEWLKDLWANKDFTELGKLWGKKLRDWLESIPWEKIRKTSNDLGKCLATLINGLVEVERLGFDIGYTVAQGVNTVFEFINGFVHNLHWDSVGKFIADMFNGFFETIDWPLIKDTVITGLKGLATAIQTFIENFHWDNISNFIINAVDVVASGIKTFFEGIKWKDLGAKIGDQLTKTIRGIPWQEVGEALGDILQAAIDFCSGIIDNLHVEDVIKALGDLWAGITDRVNFKQAGENLGKALQFLADTIIGFWDEHGDEIKQKFHEFFSGLWETLDDNLPELLAIAWDIGWQIIKEIIRGIWDNREGVKTIFNIALTIGLASAIKTILASALVKGFSTLLAKALFGGGVVGGGAAGGGVFSAAGLAAGAQFFVGFYAAVKQFETNVNVLQPVVLKLAEVFGMNTEHVDKLRDSYSGLHGTMDMLKDGATAAWYALTGRTDEINDLNLAINKNKDSLDDANKAINDNETASNNLIKVYKSEKEVLEDQQKAHENVIGSYKSHWDIVNQNKDATDKLTGSYSTNEDVLKEYNDILTDASAYYKDLLGVETDVVGYTPTYTGAMSDMQTSMSETSAVAKETGENIIEGIKEPMRTVNFDTESKGVFDTLFKALSFVFGIASPAKNMKPIGENIVLGIDEGMTDNFDSFTTTMQDFYDNYVKKWFDKDTWSFDGVAEGLKSTFEGAKKAIAGVWNGIADKMNGDFEVGDKKFKINLPKFSYATGGFPEDGFFFANHSELVGQFSNGKTAVANNAQIVEGIQSGVYNAVMSAMSQQSGGSSYISNEIILDGEVVARSITKAQEKMNRRYSPQTV